MSKKILVVDDDPDIVNLLAQRLQSNHYEVIVALDAVEARKKAFTEKPDLILLDYMLPAGTGIAVFEDLRKSTKTMLIPVIFITANATEAVKQKTSQMGARDFITKPFVAEDLLFKIKKVLGKTDE